CSWRRSLLPGRPVWPGGQALVQPAPAGADRGSHRRRLLGAGARLGEPGHPVLCASDDCPLLRLVLGAAAPIRLFHHRWSAAAPGWHGIGADAAPRPGRVATGEGREMMLTVKTRFYALVALQLLLLGGLIAGKQITLAAGERILLQTVPVDPRDMFRGD